MPKVKPSKRTQLNSFVREFGPKIFTTDGSILFCTSCSKTISAERRFNVEQHCNSDKHKKNLSLKDDSEKRQTLLFKNAAEDPQLTRKSEFASDLCDMMMSADIPINKLNNPKFENFLTKWTNQHVPSESTIRKNYVGSVYENVLEKIRLAIGDNKIWVSIDETTDVEKRHIANVIVGTMPDDKAGESFLLCCEELEKANSSTIAMLFEQSMNVLWPNGVKRENVLLFVSDAAPYMVKAGEGLKLFFPKMTHITCLAHGLHRIAEEIRELYPKVDLLIANVKKIFIKCPSRVLKFKEMLPGTPLPPEPIVTRWGTWLDASIYYCTHFESIKNIVNSFDDQDASSIKIAKDVLTDKCLLSELVFIKSNFGIISQSITKLEAKGIIIHESVDLIETIQSKLKLVRGKIGERVNRKFQNVLAKNAGYSFVSKIARVLDGNQVTFQESEPDLSCNDFTLFNYAPITSCDVERSFSSYKTMLANNRRSFLIENFKKFVVVHCNSNQFA